MHRRLLVLSLLMAGPVHGYELHRAVRSHGDLYADLKRGNLYYLLERLETDGCVTGRDEGGESDGRQRRVYTVTDRGREEFDDLLRQVVGAYTPAYAGMEVGLALLARRPRAEAIELLEQRLSSVGRQRDAIDAQVAAMSPGDIARDLAVDHLLDGVRAEADWLTRAIKRIESADEWPGDSDASRR